MKIYTSYFANLKNIPGEILPVSIARFSPKWFSGERMESLAPEKKLLWKAKQGKISEKEYTELYLAGLNILYTTESLLEKLKQIYDNRDIVFLCYEKRGDFCHRRLLAGWLEKGIDIRINEL